MKNIILNSNLKDDYVKLVELYVRNSIYGCQEEIALYAIDLQKKLFDISPEDRELMKLFFITGQGWVDTKLPQVFIEMVKCKDETDCKRIADILVSGADIINQDIIYLTSVEVVDSNNYDMTMEKLANVYRDIIAGSEEDMGVVLDILEDNIDNNNIELNQDEEGEMENNNKNEEEVMKDTKENETETTEEVVEEVVETKSSKKWYYIGAVVVVAAIGGIAYAYKKFQEKDIIIISSDDL